MRVDDRKQGINKCWPKGKIALVKAGFQQYPIYNKHEHTIHTEHDTRNKQTNIGLQYNNKSILDTTNN